ncbi:LamG domain-containing protein [Actinacidiphila guanduensis]|uniref:Glycosyl hydrolases family 16 n=1 Tax=Actinacidiphila guanduensis TaxID=310781 RepID=A0A1G9VK04_9ACTN|nr:family 16 glycosylhydrolase [Actinacidiphila guanduensis]SDM72552.1 Glycosyl hydrolases family 16 [Actinacidiphila guanduensis]
MTTDRTEPQQAAAAPIVFDAPFTDRSAWAVGRTSAYPGSGRNPGDNKLDQIGPGYGPTPDGVFRARRASTALWHTDLVSTEYASGGFELLPGDVLSATCTVQDEQGAWPSLWTWGRDSAGGRPQPGHGEIDAFEYHGGNPHILELSNHVREAGHYADGAVTPGRPFALEVSLGADSVVWRVDGTVLFSDGRGVGPSWRAWLVVSMSVSAGGYGHAAPRPGVRELQWRCTDLQVRRPRG